MGKRPSEHRSFLTRQQRRFRNVRRRLIGWITAPVIAVLKRLPLVILRPLLRTLVGRSIYLAFRHDALRNIRTALGPERTDAELRAIVKTSCLGLGDSLAEVLVASRRGFAPFLEMIENPEVMKPVHEWEANNRCGWIALSGHIGNWELLGPWVTHNSRGERTMVVAKRAPNKHLNKQVEKLRSELSLDTIYQDESPTPAIRGLRDGRVVGLIPDQDIKTISGMFVDFLGRPAFTPVGPARIAIASRAPIFCVCLLRKGRGFRAHLGPPIHVDPTLSRNDQIATITKAWSKQLEDLIREHPEQWQWLHNRWKTTPEKLAARGRKALM